MVFRPSMWVKVKGNIFKLKKEYGGREEKLTKKEIAEFNSYQKKKRKITKSEIKNLAVIMLRLVFGMFVLLITLMLGLSITGVIKWI